MGTYVRDERDAGGGTRTLKGVSPPAPKTGASANSATPAAQRDSRGARVGRPRPRGAARAREAPSATSLVPWPARAGASAASGPASLYVPRHDEVGEPGLRGRLSEPREGGQQALEGRGRAPASRLRRPHASDHVRRLVQARGPEARRSDLGGHLPRARVLCRGALEPGRADDRGRARNPPADRGRDRRAGAGGPELVPAQLVRLRGPPLAVRRQGVRIGPPRPAHGAAHPAPGAPDRVLRARVLTG